MLHRSYIIVKTAFFGVVGCAYLTDVTKEAKVVVVVVVEVDNFQVVSYVRAVGVHRLIVGVAITRVRVRVTKLGLRTHAFCPASSPSS